MKTFLETFALICLNAELRKQLEEKEPLVLKLPLVKALLENSKRVGTPIEVKEAIETINHYVDVNEHFYKATVNVANSIGYGYVLTPQAHFSLFDCNLVYHLPVLPPLNSNHVGLICFNSEVFETTAKIELPDTQLVEWVEQLKPLE